MQKDLCLDLELSIENYAIFFLGDPVIQADTPIKQCCNFSRDSLAFETDWDM